MKKIVAQKINLPDCEYPGCKKFGEYRILSEFGSEYFCDRHFQIIKSDNKGNITEGINLGEISLQNRGLFRTKSIAEVNSKLAFERWKDFGFERKTFILSPKIDQKKQLILGIIEYEISLMPRKEWVEIKLTNFYKEKFHYWKFDFSKVWDFPMIVYKNVKTGKIDFIEYKTSVVFMF